MKCYRTQLTTLATVLTIGFAATLTADPPGGNPVDRVPADFATIQDAIDNGTAPVIRVSSGSHAGAFVTRPVELVGLGQCVIDSGVAITASIDAGLALESGASGSVIRNFIFDDVDLGIYSSCSRLGSIADDIVVKHNTFINNSEAVVATDGACGGGNDWIIEHNAFVDIRSDISNCGGGLGVFLINVDHAVVRHNNFTGTLAAPPGCAPNLFSVAAIFMSGVTDSFIIHNDFDMADGGNAFKFDIALFGFQPDGGPSTNIVIANNDFRGSDAPFFDSHIASFDGFGLSAQCNFGTTLIDHATGDGDSEFFEETNCKRRDLSPSDALSVPAVANP